MFQIKFRFSFYIHLPKKNIFMNTDLQIIYLDFDGELTSFNGEILTLDNVEVSHSNLTPERIRKITDSLNLQYAEKNIRFVTEQPLDSNYSTIFIGKTNAFSEYGDFAGLSETVDHDNQIKNDNAFVFLDAADADSDIISTIAHEAEHLSGTLDHGGEGLEKYARITFDKDVLIPTAIGINKKRILVTVSYTDKNQKTYSLYAQYFDSVEHPRENAAPWYDQPMGLIQVPVKDLDFSCVDLTGKDKIKVIMERDDTDPEALDSSYEFVLNIKEYVFDYNDQCRILSSVKNTADYQKKGFDYQAAESAIFGTKTTKTINKWDTGVSINETFRQLGMKEGKDWEQIAADTSQTDLDSYLRKGYGVIMTLKATDRNTRGDAVGHTVTLDSVKDGKIYFSDSSDNLQGHLWEATIREDGKISSTGSSLDGHYVDSYILIPYESEINLKSSEEYNLTQDRTFTKTSLEFVNIAKDTTITLGSGMTLSGDISVNGKLNVTTPPTIAENTTVTLHLTTEENTTAYINDINPIKDADIRINLQYYTESGNYIIADNGQNFDGSILLTREMLIGTGELSDEVLPGYTTTMKFGNLAELGLYDEVTLNTGKYKLTLDSNNRLILQVISYQDIAAPSIPGQFKAAVQGENIQLNWNAATDNKSGVKEYLIEYTCNGVSGEIKTTGTTYAMKDAAPGDYSIKISAIDNVGNISGASGVQNVIMLSKLPYDLNGNQNGLSWGKTALPQYIVEISKDNFKTSTSISTSDTHLDTFALPVGSYKWRVRCTNSNEWIYGSTINASTANTPVKWSSDEDGSLDVFFARPADVWSELYAAEHTGLQNEWQGTGEIVSLGDKNRLTDLYEGSTDANILLMTDDLNGDTLFLDDIYSALPSGMDQQARIAGLQKIHAGAGDDVVDMTSRQFKYTGNGVRIYGGSGDDTIWANKGNNILSGDDGNDRLVGASGDDILIGGNGNDSMHGGGGNDIFTFGTNWGKDTVEQLSDGHITLWFENGSTANWNKNTLTYSDGVNSVEVSGGFSGNITLLFGDDQSSRYDELADAGAFEGCNTTKIYTLA